MPAQNVPALLAPTGPRTSAAEVLGAAAVLEPAAAGLIVSALDLVSGALLVGLAGLPAGDARAVLVELWTPGGAR